MILRDKESFLCSTKHTSYCFRVMETGHLEHLYYGRKITANTQEELSACVEPHVFPLGNSIAYNQNQKKFSLEDVRLEMSSYGKGDIREPLIEVVHSDGSITSDFLFEKAEIAKGKEEFETLPGSYGTEDEVEHLLVTLRDKQYDLKLELHYYIYEDCDVITRCTKLYNEGKEPVELKRLMSMQLDFDTPDYVFTTFHGAWAREMEKTSCRMTGGKLVNSSYTGTSSSRSNPFVMLEKETTTEDYGDCYGFNLIYSGNHYEAVEVHSGGKTRIVSGINPQSFSFRIEPGESFEAPEAVMSYSEKGCNGMSRNMHRFVREHIVRGVWKERLRPVLLNSWEASYFDINEKKLLSLAKAGKEAGVELFVMDDGWFGNREDDTQSLGDWEENQKKLPHGLSGLCQKIKALGLDFGIWVEPEMVNVKSRLYEEHPQWVMQIPGKPHSEGRNQRILDMGQVEVQDYIITYNEEPIVSAFHSMSSGKTESAENAWGSAVDYLVSVDSSFDKSAPKYFEETAYPKEVLQEKLKSAFPDIQLGEDFTQWLSVKDVSDAGTVLSMTAGNLTVSGNDMRTALSLRSASFEINYTASEAVFATKGYGHGVGMSQYGANSMAVEGKTWQDILNHYYSGCEIVLQ